MERGSNPTQAVSTFHFFLIISGLSDSIYYISKKNIKTIEGMEEGWPYLKNTLGNCGLLVRYVKIRLIYCN